ncbi:unnamed protein product [Cyclocybe aegerita]|uniref:Uncharacterized protein n=1 Tax=Cyclocybe aegerita TaxID=1973307 RepID=A0A8S0WZ07_CYCAE|nr:unnamed protein product [Cyclocybe aegerita]
MQPLCTVYFFQHLSRSKSCQTRLYPEDLSLSIIQRHFMSQIEASYPDDEDPIADGSLVRDHLNGSGTVRCNNLSCPKMKGKKAYRLRVCENALVSRGILLLARVSKGRLA